MLLCCLVGSASTTASSTHIGTLNAALQLDEPTSEQKTQPNTATCCAGARLGSRTGYLLDAAQPAFVYKNSVYGLPGETDHLLFRSLTCALFVFILL